MSGLTLYEKYYGINSALNSWLTSKGIECPVIKYGIDPATLKNRFRDQTRSNYPYIQTYISNVRPVAWTTKESGILTEFDFQLSFFTSPVDEMVNDAAKFIPFDMARIAFTDVIGRVLSVTKPDGQEIPFATILSEQVHYEFEMKTGSPVPSAFMLARMRTVCAYPQEAVFPDPGISTDIWSGINFTE